MIRITSIQVGKPQTMSDMSDTAPSAPSLSAVKTARRGVGDHEGHPPTWTSAIAKKRIDGRIWLGRENLDGDAQADLKNHGGPDKAVLGYSLEHYGQWQDELGQALPAGAFGENFTITGLNEDMICVGDRYRVGTAIVEVSQPRQPCWKLSRLWRIPNLDSMVRNTGRTGWYYRVVEEGEVGVDDELEPIILRRNQWTVRAVSDILNDKMANPTHLQALANYEYLAQGCREVFRRRLLQSQGEEG